MKSKLMKLSALLFAGVLLLASCSAATKNESLSLGNKADSAYRDSYDYDYAYDSVVEMETAAVNNGNYKGTGSYVSSSTSAPSTTSSDHTYSDRKIIRNANLTLETKVYDNALQTVERLVSQFNGYVESSQSYGRSLSASSDARSAEFRLRIPAEALDSFISSIESEGDIFNVTDKNEYANDITAQYYDVEARLNSLLTQEERLLAMLEGATELQYMLELERTLADVRYQIESYYSQIKRYDSQVALSTVNIYLREVIEYKPVVKAPRTYLERLGDAFADSWEDFVDGVQDLSIDLVYMLPGLVIFAVIVLVIVLILRHAIKKGLKQRRQAMMTPNENKDEENK